MVYLLDDLLFLFIYLIIKNLTKHILELEKIKKIILFPIHKIIFFYFFL